ncbi:M20/M25/M40 family metallo-hydrolase [Candidatus Dojkabacteria bacterium]|uniref:M20/M25/M40 family metallo-hydrolase n=1 Tax=Candidatus Dojkabacteria bacterium TaxID=2099670 RepID=A0A955L7E1_9BACT|nr:M20/M25/M40 family metallo-hydrolase [Candidatus Dojkabacteria bacterium]
MNKSDFITKLQALPIEEEVVDLTKILCGFNTVNPPGNEELCTPTISKFLEGCGAEIAVYAKENGRDNVVGIIKGKKPGKRIAIVGHSDVVPTDGQEWEHDPFKVMTRDGKLFARGVIDNKGPFAATLVAVKNFITLTGGDFAGEIMIISAADEEQGSNFGIKYLFNELGLTCDGALIPDGGEFSEMVYGEMGILKIEISSKGKTFHSSMPEKGENAVVPLCDLIARLEKLDWEGVTGDKAFDHVVMNISMIAGGSKIDAVPDSAYSKIMWRYPLGVTKKVIMDYVKTEMDNVKNEYDYADFEIKEVQFSEPMLSSPSGILVTSAEKSASELGVPVPELKTIRGETVGKYMYQATGCEVLVNGPQDDSIALMHQPNEWVAIDSLVKFSEYYTVLLANCMVYSK